MDVIAEDLLRLLPRLHRPMHIDDLLDILLLLGDLVDELLDLDASMPMLLAFLHRQLRWTLGLVLASP